MTPKTRLLNDPALTAKFSAAKAAVAAYALAMLESYDYLNPAEATKRIQQELANVTDPSTIAAKTAKLQELVGPAASVLTTTARHHCQAKLRQAKAELASLLASAKALLQSYHSEAVQKEAQFFASEELPRQTTEVSARYLREIGIIDNYISGIANPPPRVVEILPGPSNTALESYFGLDFAE